MTADEIKPIRMRLLHFLSPEVAALVGLDPMRLAQVAIGRVPLSDDQWLTLARRMSMPGVAPVLPAVGG
jgi:hypothetical protein